MKKELLVLISILFTGCNPLNVLCFDDPDCPRHYYYCPIEKKKVHVHYSNISTICDPNPCLCPEIFTPRSCQICVTRYTDDQGHTWETKPFKEKMDHFVHSEMCK